MPAARGFVYSALFFGLAGGISIADGVACDKLREFILRFVFHEIAAGIDLSTLALFPHVSA
jgi:hypothetical protein